MLALLGGVDHRAGCNYTTSPLVMSNDMFISTLVPYDPG